MNLYDVIVVGTGGVGSATLYHLAQRGIRVLGIDRFGPAHDRGSSHGETRLIRQAYFEHPNYVPLLLSAYEIWHELEQAATCQLLLPTGLLEVGPPDGVVLPGVAASAYQHGLAVEELNATELAKRFPQFNLPQECEAVFEPTAGVLLVEACVRHYLEKAGSLGAEMRYNEPVVDWRVIDNGVEVQTVSGRYRAGHLIISAGAWSSRLLDSLGLPLRVIRKHLHWFAVHDECHLLRNGCPAFFFELSDGCFYGFPAIDSGGFGVKAAEHSGGEAVVDPSNLDQSVDMQEQDRVVEFLKHCVPGVSTCPTHHAVCMYTLTPDEHFIIDHHPNHPQVCFATGLSGHGFKFAPVLGKALSDLTLDRATTLPVSFLGLSRFGHASS